MSILKFRKSEHSNITIADCPSNKSDWFKSGYRYVEGAAVTTPTAQKDIDEWNAGVLQAVSNIGLEEHADPSIYYDKLVNFDGSKVTTFFDKPIVIQPVKDTRVDWADSTVEGAPPIRDKVLFCEGPESEGGNPTGVLSKKIKIGENEYEEYAYWGFISVFEKDISDAGAQSEVWEKLVKEKNLEDIREFNVGVLAGQHYKKTGKIDEKTIQKLRDYVNGKKEVKSESKSEKVEKKEKTNMSTAAKSGGIAAAVSEQTTVEKIKEVVKTKGVIVAHRTAARQINKGLKELVINKLSESGKNSREVARIKETLTTVFSTPFGDAILGIAASQVIPFVAKAVGQEANPHVNAIAEECGIEGTVQVADMIADMLKAGAMELGSIVQSAIASIPAEATA